MPTTNVGRIVYERPTHFFRYRDINRIVKVVKPGNISEVPDMVFTLVRVFEDLASLGKEKALDLKLAGIPIAIPPAVALTMLEFVLQIYANLGEGVIKWIRNGALSALHRLSNIIVTEIVFSDRVSTEPTGKQ